MASEERYLWLCTYQFRGEDCLWWGYFRSQQEVEKFRRQVEQSCPAVKFTQVEECKDGMSVGIVFYHSRLSLQRQFVELLAKVGEMKYRGNELFAPFLFSLSDGT